MKVQYKIYDYAYYIPLYPNTAKKRKGLRHYLRKQAWLHRHEKPKKVCEAFESFKVHEGELVQGRVVIHAVST